MAVTNYITINGKIHGQETGGVSTGYATDALGSVVATVNSSGNVANTYRYKPYGALLAKTGTSADPKSQWVGSYGYRSTRRTQSESYIRARHYGQKPGMWTTSDPINDDDNTLRYCTSKPNTCVDPSGLLSIVPVPGQSKLKGRCGGETYHSWDFVLARPAPCDGYFVQEVVVLCIPSRCENGCCKEEAAQEFKYYEAWFVSHGDRKFERRASNPPDHPYTDQFLSRIPDNTCGTYLQLGEVRFYCESTTTRLKGLKSNWRLYGVYGSGLCTTNAGGSVNTPDTPSWWKRTKPIERSALRVGFTSWSCCNKQDQWVKSHAAP